MSTGPDFTEYDKAMSDPAHRAMLERAELTEAEEEAMYDELDAALGDD